MHSSSASTACGQERRFARQVASLDQGSWQDSDKEGQITSRQDASRKGATMLKSDTFKTGLNFMKVQEKGGAGIVLRPFTLVIVSLLFLVVFFTVTIPIAKSFESEQLHSGLAAQRQLRYSSRRAQNMVKQHFDDVREMETKINMVITKKERIYSRRSRLSYWQGLRNLLEPLANDATEGPLRLGVINYDKQMSNDVEEELWGSLTSIDVVPNVLAMDRANRSITWKDLYPESIDETGILEVPQCPTLPMPEVEANSTLDVAYVEVPCDTTSDHWRRDVPRLHLQLALAHVAIRTNCSFIVLSSSCPPLPNLFHCKDLLANKGPLWLYKVDKPQLSRRTSLPVGSCELTPPFKVDTLQQAQPGIMPRREAYATILHSAEIYVCGAIALANSIRRTGSRRDMVILVDENIQQHNRQGLEEAGWIVIQIERIRNPKAEEDSYNEWNYSKLRLWQLTAYQKVIFLDSDVLVLQNIDFVFESEEISASSNSESLFNSGVMVVEPHNCTFNLLMNHIDTIFSYNGGDQGFLNEVFPWWHRLPRRLNFLKHFASNSQEEFEEKTKLFALDPPDLYVLHYLGFKPWLCFRDYDCSWLYPQLLMFASDVAHATWWNLYDSMPDGLQRYCDLSVKQSRNLAYDIANIEVSPLLDPALHRQWKISDPRFRPPIESIHTGSF